MKNNIASSKKQTLKNDISVIWGVKLWAPFHPWWYNDLLQNSFNCSENGPFGHAYKIYSLGELSSKNGSFTWDKSQFVAVSALWFPVAAKALSLRK